MGRKGVKAIDICIFSNSLLNIRITIYDFLETACLFVRSKPDMGKLGPAGQIRPAGSFILARRMLSICCKTYFCEGSIGRLDNSCL